MSNSAVSTLNESPKSTVSVTGWTTVLHHLTHTVRTQTWTLWWTESPLMNWTPRKGNICKLMPLDKITGLQSTEASGSRVNWSHIPWQGWISETLLSECCHLMKSPNSQGWARWFRLPSFNKGTGPVPQAGSGAGAEGAMAEMFRLQGGFGGIHGTSCPDTTITVTSWGLSWVSFTEIRMSSAQFENYRNNCVRVLDADCVPATVWSTHTCLILLKHLEPTEQGLV